MKDTQTLKMIQWLKRIAATLTIVVWLFVMIVFIKDPAPFAELVPYCMGSTMLIFGVLTSVFKGLEYWESKVSSE
jgi:peptidoglycan/LPS O-acetylase OafA/YrhL